MAKNRVPAKTMLESLDTLIAEHHLLKHPFYQAWTEGKLSKESLQLYAEQYYQHVRAFPENLRELAGRANGPLAEMVKENLAEELDPSGSHPALWRQFAQSLGVSDAALDSARPLPGIAALLDTYDEVVSQGTMTQAVAVVLRLRSPGAGNRHAENFGAAAILQHHRTAGAGLFRRARRSRRAPSRCLARLARESEGHGHLRGAMRGRTQPEGAVGRARRGLSAGEGYEELSVREGKFGSGMRVVVREPRTAPCRLNAEISADVFPQNRQSAAPSDENLAREFQKHPVFHRTHNVIEMVRDLLRIFHGPKCTIDDVVSAVGDEGLAVFAKSQRGISAKLAKPALRGFPSKLHHLHGHRKQECRAACSILSRPRSQPCACSPPPRFFRAAAPRRVP